MMEFVDIPSQLRLPGVYVEFDSSKANSGQMNYKLLVIGQRLASGSVGEGVPTQVLSASQAEEYFGRGSMLAEQLAAIKAASKWVDTWAVALDEPAGSAAAGTITITGPATAAGSLVLYIAGKKVLVPVALGDDATAVAAAVVAAVNENTTLPVTAANASGVVTLTCRWNGETGNDIDVRTNYYGEQFPSGVGVSVSEMAGGSGNPDIATAIASFGDEWWNWIVCPFNDAVNLSALELELASRYGPMRQIGARAFTAFRGNHAQTATHGGARNSPHVTCMGTNIAPQPPYIWASVNAVVAARALLNDPARPLQTLVLPGIMPPAIELRWTDSERNLLLYDGVASYKSMADGSVSIERQITMYQTNGSGLPDDSYLDINVPETLERIRYRQRALFLSVFPRHKLAEDNARVTSGQAVMQPKLAKAHLLNLYRQMELDGWVQAYDEYKSQLVVQVGDGVGGGDRNRLNVQDSPKLVGQYRVHAHQSQFTK